MCVTKKAHQKSQQNDCNSTRTGRAAARVFAHPSLTVHQAEESKRPLCISTVNGALHVSRVSRTGSG